MSLVSTRIDAWLWRARFFKTRAGATDFVAKGRVRLSRPGRRTAPVRPSFAVAPGDVLTFSLNARLVCVSVAALGVRRGPPPEARTLYTLVETAAPPTSSGMEAS